MNLNNIQLNQYFYPFHLTINGESLSPETFKLSFFPYTLGDNFSALHLASDINSFIK